MYKDELLEKLKTSGKLVFSTSDAAELLHIHGPELSNLLRSMDRHGHIEKIMRGKYYLKSAPVKDIFAIASKIIEPSYVATESAFERFGLSNIVPSIIRVVSLKGHKPISIKSGKIVFIRFGKKRFFGYNESRWISISSIEKAFVDSMYLGEFPFFTDLVEYHRRMVAYGRTIDYNKLVEYAIKMDSKALLNRAGFFLDYIGKQDAALPLLSKIYKKRRIAVDKSGQEFNNAKWMIR